MNDDQEARIQAGAQALAAATVQLHGLRLMLYAAYMRAPTGSDAENDLAAAQRNAAELLMVLEQGWAAMQPQELTTPVSTPTPEPNQTIH